MPTTYFLVRSVVAAPQRQKFDHWYKCEKAWRFWSDREEGVHYAVYRFADRPACDAALGSEDFKALVADFNRVWPGITRTTWSRWWRNAALNELGR